jgi:hypothetical protein
LASEQNNSNEKKLKLHPGWVLPLFYKPARTTSEIVSQEKPVWLTPLLILSILVILMTLVSAPVRRNAVQMGSETPPDFQYYSPEQQEQYFAAQANQTSPLMLYVFPLLGGLVKTWLSWFLLSILLYLSLTLAGSRAGSMRSYNLVAWSMLPLALRLIVQIMAVVISKNLISSPGVSGFIDAEATGIAAYLRGILATFDIYFIFQVILLFIGVIPLSGLNRSKAWVATAISIVILLLLQGIPGLLSSALSGLSLSGGFYF